MPVLLPQPVPSPVPISVGAPAVPALGPHDAVSSEQQLPQQHSKEEYPVLPIAAPRVEQLDKLVDEMAMAGITAEEFERIDALLRKMADINSDEDELCKSAK